jgi:hypothetical protein
MGGIGREGPLGGEPLGGQRSAAAESSGELVDLRYAGWRELAVVDPLVDPVGPVRETTEGRDDPRGESSHLEEPDDRGDRGQGDGEGGQEGDRLHGRDRDR